MLMIKIDKLKTREKYERHFLLLALVFSLMVKIRKWCDDCFGSLSDREKLENFSRPKGPDPVQPFLLSFIYAETVLFFYFSIHFSGPLVRVCIAIASLNQLGKTFSVP